MPSGGLQAGKGFSGRNLCVVPAKQADTGTKMVHIGKNTRSRIVSKGISAGHSRNCYRGLVQARLAALRRVGTVPFVGILTFIHRTRSAVFPGSFG